MAAEPSFEADSDDYWGRAVSLLTGYMMPKRSALFDKLKSEGDIPLFRMGFKDMSMRPVAPEDYAAISGWMTHKGEDYDLVFYTAKGRDSVKMQRARIVFIGVLTDENGRAVLYTGPRAGGQAVSSRASSRRMRTGTARRRHGTSSEAERRSRRCIQVTGPPRISHTAGCRSRTSMLSTSRRSRARRRHSTG